MANEFVELPPGDTQPLGPDAREMRESIDAEQDAIDLVDDMVTLVSVDLDAAEERLDASDAGLTTKDQERRQQDDLERETLKSEKAGAAQAAFSAPGAEPTEPGVQRVQEQSVRDAPLLGGQREAAMDSGQRTPEETETETLAMAELGSTVNTLINEVRLVREAVDELEEVGTGEGEDAVAPSPGSFHLEDRNLDGGDPGVYEMMYYVTQYDYTNVYVRPGIWVRSGNTNGTSHLFSSTFDPASLAAAGPSFTGVVNGYVLLCRGDGRGSSFDDSDLAPSSSNWGSGTWPGNGCQIIWVTDDGVGPIAPSAGYGDPQKQWQWIAQIHYSSGVITKIEQVHLGPIHDSDPLNAGIDGTDTAYSFPMYIEYNGNAYTMDFHIGEGYYKHRGAMSIQATASYSITDAQIQAASPPIKIYASILPNDATLATDDPSLNPQTPRIVSPATTPSYNDSQWDGGSVKALGQVLLAIITGHQTYGGGTAATISMQRFHFGAIYQDYHRADGTSSGISSVDTDVPNAETLDEISTGAHQGELQDRQFYEDCVAGSTILNYAGDYGLAYYLYDPTGTTEKKYTRIDSHDGTSWLNSGLSIEINNRLQLRNFGLSEPTPVSISYAGPSACTCPTTGWSPAPPYLNGATGSYLILGRKEDSTTPTLEYLDLSNLHVPYACQSCNSDTADHSTTSDSATDADNADYADEAGGLDATGLLQALTYITNHLYHNYDTWVLTTTAPTSNDLHTRYWDQGNIYTRNYGGSIGRSTVSEAINLTNSQLKNANWSVQDGYKFSTSNGQTSAELSNGVEGLYAAYGGTTWASIARVAQAGRFSDGTQQCDLCDGAYAVNGTGSIRASLSYYVAGNKVVGGRGAAVADVAGATAGTATLGGYGFVSAVEMNTFIATVAEIKTQLNALLSRVRASTGHGLIA